MVNRLLLITAFFCLLITNSYANSPLPNTKKFVIKTYTRKSSAMTFFNEKIIPLLENNDLGQATMLEVWHKRTDPQKDLLIVLAAAQCEAASLSKQILTVNTTSDFFMYRNPKANVVKDRSRTPATNANVENLFRYLQELRSRCEQYGIEITSKNNPFIDLPALSEYMNKNKHGDYYRWMVDHDFIVPNA